MQRSAVGDKIVSAKDFEQARLNYENAKVAYEAIAGKQTAKGVSVVSPLNGYLKNIQVKEGDCIRRSAFGYDLAKQSFACVRTCLRGITTIFP